MLYREYRPAAPLAPYIEAYWLGDALAGEGETYRVFPDGCVDIIFHIDRTGSALSAGIIGAMTTYINVSHQSGIQMFGIRFKPAGITAFTRVPVDEFTDRSVELTSAETLFCASFHEALSGKKSAEELIKHTDGYLLSRLPYTYRQDGRIVRAVDLISLAKGRLSVSEAAGEVCLCRRHFERNFKASVGVSPKTFAGIIRFKHALRYLRSHPARDLLSAAVEYGYYDHSHLIKDFKSMSGNTPGDIRR
jgi:AraC-like DNA-binding protein